MASTKYLATSVAKEKGKKCFKKIVVKQNSKYSAYELLQLELAGNPHSIGIGGGVCDARTGEPAKSFTETWQREDCLAVDVDSEELAAQLRTKYPMGKRLEGTYVNIFVRNR